MGLGMDDRRFDRMTKAFATGRSRRALLQGLLGLGGAAGALGLAGMQRAGAAACRPPGSGCRGHGNCCSHLCGPKNATGRRRCGCQSPADCPAPDQCHDATCLDGMCGTAVRLDQACDDGDPCTNNVCDATGNCSTFPACGNHPEDCCPGCLDCQDDGTCAANTLTCTDTGVDGCLVGTCDSHGNCSYEPNHALCVNTGVDGCLIGTCNNVGSCSYAPSDALCNDQNPCTYDVCNADGTCSHTFDCTNDWHFCCVGCLDCNGTTGQCDANLDRCTQTGECRVATACDDDGVCHYEADHDRCDDGNECTSNTCLAANDGTCFTLTLPSTTSCLDGKGHCDNRVCICNCVTNGVCYAVGDENPANACQTCTQDGWAPEVSICFTANPCQTAKCDNGQCTISDKTEGATCQVFTVDPCKRNVGTCQHGECVPRNLNEPNGTFCFSESCNEDEFCQSCQCVNGACSPGPANNGQLCGIQPDDECQRRTCVSGQCTITDAPGKLGKSCKRPSLCESGFCQKDPPFTALLSCHLEQTNNCEISPPAGCTDVICNQETGACDVYVGEPNGTLACLGDSECCPSQYCFKPSTFIIGTCWNDGESPSP
jgi:hypothetical protein